MGKENWGSDSTAATIDPKGIIQEAFRIEGIDASQCRSIFLDWALTQPVDADHAAQAAVLLERYGSDQPDHPMTKVLRDGCEAPKPAKRRGGWKSRAR